MHRKEMSYMKIHKGEAGYIKCRKKRLLIETIIEFGIIIGLLVVGYVQTKTRLNMLSVAAVLGCLPACRTLVNLIMLFPHKSIKEEIKQEIAEKAPKLHVIYDLIVTSEKKAMAIDAFVISENTICGYTSNPLVNKGYCADFIKAILQQNGIEKVTVKVFRDYVAFLTRAEGMNSIASIDKQDQNRAEAIQSLILDISL